MEVKPRYRQTEVGVIPESWEVTKEQATIDQFAADVRNAGLLE